MVEMIVGYPLLVGLGVIAFLSGIGITTVGPGGIFVTIALYSLTALPASLVAGTAHMMFIATGLVGSAVYVHSGEMKTGQGRSIAILLSVSSLLGALIGAFVNPLLPRALFGLLLGAVSMATGASIVYRDRRGLTPLYRVDATARRGQFVLGSLGFTLGIASGMLGVGGPVLAVPALIVVGVPMLLAVAVAQVQSIFIALFAATGYVLQGNVSLSLAGVLGLPLLAGVVVGWKIAHLVAPARLKVVLGIVLVAVGPFLAV